MNLCDVKRNRDAINLGVDNEKVKVKAVPFFMIELNDGSLSDLCFSLDDGDDMMMMKKRVLRRSGN